MVTLNSWLYFMEDEVKAYLPCLGAFNLCVQIFLSGFVSLWNKSIRNIWLGIWLWFVLQEGISPLELFHPGYISKSTGLGFVAIFFVQGLKVWSHAFCHRFLQCSYWFILFSVTYILTKTIFSGLYLHVFHILIYP